MHAWVCSSITLLLEVEEEEEEEEEEGIFRVEERIIKFSLANFLALHTGLLGRELNHDKGDHP